MQPGKQFFFKLNGIPVPVKGANYIPADSFLPRATDSTYQAIVDNAAAAHMNMLPVWGSGAMPMMPSMKPVIKGNFGMARLYVCLRHVSR